MNVISPYATTAAHLGPIRTFLKETLAKQKGAMGFAPGILEDADDTARVLLTLQCLGEEVNFTPMIARFRSESYFRTYELEQNPSFSANCNILLALVQSNSVQDHLSEIETITRFLLSLWNAGNVSDKWNRSSRYCFMLLSSAFVGLLQRYDNGDLAGLPSALIEREIPICLCQILSRTLSQQDEDGSWEDSLEATAYSLLSVSQILHLPLSGDLRGQLMSSFYRGRDYIVKHQHQPMQPRSHHDYLWIEKVTYGSALLRKVYPTTAVHASCEPLSWTRELTRCFQVPAAASKIKLLLNQVHLFKQCPLISVDLAIVEAMHWSGFLHECKHAIFPKDGMQVGKDKYLEFIPIIWTTCNQLGNDALSPDTLRAMIFLSLLIYQVDEFMESVVAHLSEPAIQVIERRIKRECDLESEDPKSEGAGSNGTTDADQMEDAVSPESVVEILRRFIGHILHHPRVIESSPTMRKEVSEELYSFLLAHTTHIRENRRLKAERSQQKTDDGSTEHHAPSWRRRSYHKWVHSVAAEDTSCPVSYVFFICLISTPGQCCFDNVRSKYLSRSVMGHLAAMCRQYNDYGSAMRDRDEDNLNSMDFVDFREPQPYDGHDAVTGGDVSNGAVVSGANGTSPRYPTQVMKDQLMEIAEFERSCMQLAWHNLAQVTTSEATMKRVGVFVDVTDLFGQLYIHRDLTNRIQARG
jgi:hypothetical protein